MAQVTAAAVTAMVTMALTVVVMVPQDWWEQCENNNKKTVGFMYGVIAHPKFTGTGRCMHNLFVSIIVNDGRTWHHELRHAGASAS